MPTTTTVTLRVTITDTLADATAALARSLDYEDAASLPEDDETKLPRLVRAIISSELEWACSSGVTVEALGPAVETTLPDPPDYEVMSGGLHLVLIRPVSRAARQWLADHVGAVETFAGGIAVEPRYLQALLDGLNEDGLRGVER